VSQVRILPGMPFSMSQKIDHFLGWYLEHAVEPLLSRFPNIWFGGLVMFTIGLPLIVAFAYHVAVGRESTDSKA